MRCFERNKTEFYYSLLQGKEPLKDENGYDTGEYTLVYTLPIKMRASVSSSKGEAQVEQFGNALDYDKVIITDDIACPLDEHSVLCIDCKPDYDDEGNLIYDYIVKKVARSINGISYAVRKVQKR